MASLNQIIYGLKKYMDAEVLPKITGWNKWVVGAGFSLMLENSTQVFNSIKENPIIKSMNIINKDDEIDLDKLYSSILEQAKKSAITFDVPMIGTMTLKANDVERLYSFIKNEK